MSKISGTKKPKGTIYTDEQWQAISGRGGNILVSASAGSGKTQVLTSRVMDHLLHGLNINELLIVTFTNAAAREMKERIQKGINQALDETTDPQLTQHLLRQNAKMGQAYISTLHSFCLRVIERYYYLIDFDPVFRQLTDETEIAMIKEDVWEDLFAEMLTEAAADEDEMYQQFFFNYATDREEDSLFEMVQSLYNFSMAKPNPEEWLKNLPELYEIHGDLSHSKLYQAFIKPNIQAQLTHLAQMNQQLLDAAQSQGEDLAATVKVLENDQQLLHHFDELLENDQLEALVDATLRLKFSPWRSGKEKSGQYLKPMRDQIKADFTQLMTKYFSIAIEKQQHLIQEVHRSVIVLVEMTLAFKARYQAHKRAEQLVDFNDLEQLTIQILKTATEDYSMAAEYYQDLFAEVMVDEYQDTNEVQEEILRLVTRQHSVINAKYPKAKTADTSMYMVGDVKQSIYGFRLADPSLFQKKYQHYQAEDSGNLITLAKNFRSREQLLKATNLVFKHIMREETGNIPYTGTEELQLGYTDYPKDEAMNAEVLLIDANEETTEPLAVANYTKDERIAQLLVTKIKHLMSAHTVIYDKKLQAKRPATLDDMVVLTRTHHSAEAIKRIFDENHLPVILDDSQNFLKTIEVTTILSVLKIIDNPEQDIPFVAVLSSPIVHVDAVELTRIRLEDKQSSFYTAFCKFLAADFVDPINQKLQAKLKRFNHLLTKWRNLANKATVSTLIREIYEDTLYDSYVLGLIGGQQRHANLQALYERAAVYEQTGFKGVFRFVRFIEKMQEKDHDLAEPTINQTGTPAVRVMTIHRSKGLEFPIVFLAQMDRELILAKNKEAVFHKEMGIGLNYQNYETHEKLKVWPRLLVEEAVNQEELEEEMRVLYVAMTRAEQKLIMVGQATEKEDEKWQQIAGRAQQKGLATSDVFQAKNYLDWVVPAIYHKNISSFKPEWIAWQEMEPTTLEEQKSKASNDLSRTQQTAIDKLTTQTVNFLNTTYSHEAATATIPFQSVSEIKRLLEDPEIEERGVLDLEQVKQRHKKEIGRYVQESFAPPKFMQQQTHTLKGAELGQVVHLILQHLDLDAAQSISALHKQLEYFETEQLIKPKWKEQLPLEKIVKFFNTSFGQKIIEHQAHLQRETPFSLLIDAAHLFEGFAPGEDDILVKGIIDGYFETAEGLILFDYKTDRLAYLKDQAEKELRKRYYGQMQLYKLALETITGKQVIATQLIAIDLGQSVTVE